MEMTKQNIIMVAAVLILAVLGTIYFLIAGFHEGGSSGKTAVTVSGTVTDIFASTKVIKIKTDDNRIINLAVADDTKIQDAHNNVIDMTKIAAGAVLEIKGSYSTSDTIIPAEIKITQFAAQVQNQETAFYFNPDLKIVLRYPKTWQIDEGYSFGDFPTWFRGQDGFFGVDTFTDATVKNIDDAANSLAFDKLESYGKSPRIEKGQVVGQDAIFITPTNSDIDDAAAIIVYPDNIASKDKLNTFFLLHADKNHIHNLADTLQFVENFPQATNNFQNIIIYGPGENSEFKDALKVRGVARVFESTLTIRIKGATSGTKYFEKSVMAAAPDAGTFGLFKYDIQRSELNPQPTESLIFEAFQYSAKDGSEIDKVSVPVSFANQETTTVKAYFNNNRLDPEFSCNKVFPVNREIPKTQSLARMALEQLLAGPMQNEKDQGFSSSINDGVKIQKLTIENGIAKVDFDSQLGYQVIGSCRVGAIRAQITQTLKQFPSVKNVTISINGKTEDILQP